MFFDYGEDFRRRAGQRLDGDDDGVFVEQDEAGQGVAFRCFQKRELGNRRFARVGVEQAERNDSAKGVRFGNRISPSRVRHDLALCGG